VSKKYYKELAEVQINQKTKIFDHMKRKMQEDAARVIMYHAKKYLQKKWKKKKAKLEAEKARKQKKPGKNAKGKLGVAPSPRIV